MTRDYTTTFLRCALISRDRSVIDVEPEHKAPWLARWLPAIVMFAVFLAAVVRR